MTPGEEAREQFNREFPKLVDDAINETAKRLKLKPEHLPALHNSIVNLLIAELLRLGYTPLKDLDIPNMVRGRVCEFAFKIEDDGKAPHK